MTEWISANILEME